MCGFENTVGLLETELDQYFTGSPVSFHLSYLYSHRSAMANRHMQRGLGVIVTLHVLRSPTG